MGGTYYERYLVVSRGNYLVSNLFELQKFYNTRSGICPSTLGTNDCKDCAPNQKSGNTTGQLQEWLKIKDDPENPSTVMFHIFGRFTRPVPFYRSVIQGIALQPSLYIWRGPLIIDFISWGEPPKMWNMNGWMIFPGSSLNLPNRFLVTVHASNFGLEAHLCNHLAPGFEANSWSVFKNFEDFNSTSNNDLINWWIHSRSAPNHQFRELDVTN